MTTPSGPLTIDEADWLFSLPDSDLTEWLDSLPAEKRAAVAKQLSTHQTPTERARTSPAAFAMIAGRGKWTFPPHLQKLDQAILDTINGKDGIRRALVTMPPRHGKSELSSKYTPAWYIGRYPDRRVILASYEASFAESWGRKARDLLNEWGGLFGIKVKESPSAAAQWEIEGHGGGMSTAGVGGPLTGKGADCVVEGTLIATDIGHLPIEDVMFRCSSCRILSYNHRENRLEYRTAKAFRRLSRPGIYRISCASGRVVETTADHRFFVQGRGYTEANLLSPGDPVVRVVQDGFRQAGVRIHKDAESGARGCVLLPQVQSEASCGEESPVMPEVRKTDRKEDVRVLPRMSPRSPWEKGGSSADSDAMPDVQSTVQVDVAGQVYRSVCRLLRKGLRHAGAFAGYERPEQSKVEARMHPASSATALREGVSQCKAFDSGAGRACVCCVQEDAGYRSKESSCPPHRRMANEQCGIESCNAMQQVSSPMACGEGFVAIKDTVAMVERVRDEAVVYDIQVEGNENFFANGVLVHNCLIIDDPIKNAEEARSRTIRQKIWDWYGSTAYTRLEPDGVVILIQTRWNKDDLAGRILAEAENGGERWRVVNMPAIGDDGSALWPERFPVNRLEEIKTTLGSYHWSALYQQSPIPEGQGLFDRTHFEIVPNVPAEASRLVRFWDKAGSSTDGDFSAGVLMAHHKGVYYVVDVIRGRWSPFERNDVIEQAAELDVERWGGKVSLWIEQEPGNGGKESAMISVRDLARFGPRIDKPHTNKEARAMPFAAQVEAGNVKIVKGSWNSVYLDELTSFPNGEHDDMVDGSSGAFNKLVKSTPTTGKVPVSSRRSRI